MRDSTRQQTNQPFTLMVYYQDKVYNIQIRQQNQQFVLGTGLKVQEVKSWILQLQTTCPFTSLSYSRLQQISVFRAL